MSKISTNPTLQEKLQQMISTAEQTGNISYTEANTLRSLTPQEKGMQRIEVKFRFPIIQKNDTTVIAEIPTSVNGQLLIKGNEKAAEYFKLNDTEYDKMVDIANAAALRSIIIIE